MNIERTLLAKKNINKISFGVGILIFTTMFFGRYKPERLIWLNFLAMGCFALSLNKVDYDYEEKLLKTKKNIFLAKKRLVTNQKLQCELNQIRGIKPIVETIQPTKKLLVNQDVLNLEIEKISNETKSDFLQKMMNQSCLIIGKKGFGKSHLMRYLARSYVATMSDTDLFVIFDPHYDDENCWISDDETELIKREKIIVKNYDAKISEILALVKYRIDNKLFYKKTNSRLRIFIDEIEFFSKNDEFIELIKTIEYEGRKFGFTVVLGGHSLKKSVSNLDSSVIGSMAILMSPNVALDPVTIKPGLFPSLTTMKGLYSQICDKNRIGFFSDGENFEIVRIPNLDLWEIETVEKT